jgi:hypothetical protein
MEAVLDFGRGCQNLPIILLRGVWEGGRRGGGNGSVGRASCLCYHIWMGGGGGKIGDGLVTDCTPHACSPLSHISVLLERPLSIQKGLYEAAQLPTVL